MTRRGLTLLELLLVLGILGVFLGLALPLLSPNRLALDQAARSLATQVTRARLGGHPPERLRGPSGVHRRSGGYLLFVDQNANRRYDPGEEFGATRFGQGNWARVRLDPEKSALGNMPLLFDPRGIPAKPITATLVLTSGGATRKVVISQQGRARLE